MSATYRGKYQEEVILPRSGKGGIFCYSRVSSEDRGSKPLDVQIKTMEEYVRDYGKTNLNDKNNYGIREIYIENGMSGGAPIEKRPSLSALLKNIEFLQNDRGIDSFHIVCYDLSRLSRSVETGTKIKAFLDSRAITLHLAASRNIITGSNAELFFGLNLQMAANERISTIKRVKQAFKYKEWDNRLGYGWSYSGKAGDKPIEIESEQLILKEIRELYEKNGMSTAEIAKFIQEKHGQRRSRDKDAKEGTMLDWSSPDIAILARLHKWKWGGEGMTRSQLENVIATARAEGIEMEEFFKKNKGTKIDGVKINRPMLKKYFIEANSDWRRTVMNRLQFWIKQEKYSIDEMIDMLNEQAPRPDGDGKWARQTAWQAIKDAENLIESERIRNLLNK